MEFSLKRTTQIMAYLLIAIAVTQAIYTLLYINKVDFPRGFLWGLDALFFAMLAAFAGAAKAQSKSYHLGWSAISFSAILNVVQVTIGLTMFGAFGAAAGKIEGLRPVAGAVVSFSFMLYHAAIVLVGLAALVFAIAKMKQGSKALGGLTATVGVVAMLASAILIVLGRDTFLPSAIAGGSGVVATLLLAVCLLTVVKDD